MPWCCPFCLQIYLHVCFQSWRETWEVKCILGLQCRFPVSCILASIYEMRCACLSKIWFNSVFPKREMLHLFRQLTCQVFSSKCKWETGLMPSQFDGRSSIVVCKRYSTLLSLFCCYTEDRRFLCNSDLISYLVPAHLSMNFEAMPIGCSVTAQRSMCCPKLFALHTLYL